jgi:putative nucleotide binding protein
MEDFAFILDYLAQGPPASKRFKREPVAFALGETEFKLLELVPKQGETLNIGDRVYIGKDMDRRDKILHVKRRISYDDLTNAAQSEIPYILEEIVNKDEIRFVEFYNNAGPISTRYHTLELLPGLGKKTMWAIIEERKKKKFTTFDEISERISSIHNPKKLVIKRIELELSNPSEKYHIFVAK